DIINVFSLKSTFAVKVGMEIAGALVTGILAVLLPVVCLVLVLIFCLWAVRKVIRFFSEKNTGSP
ncbi:MAG TPA: hypothetical protein PKU72_01575, partial [Smithellaceae bacterium]|nr:hypothetical protein [Smithellaceae bacterium]